MIAPKSIDRELIDISVVIPMWNGAEVISSCIDAISADLKASGLSSEIIVVDDKSRDNSVDFVRREYPTVQVLCNAINSGFAFTVNRGMRLSRGRYILLLNTDAVVSSGSTKHVFNFMQAHPDVGGASCRVLGHDGELERSCREFPSLPATIKWRFLRLVQPFAPKFAARRSVECWPHDSERDVDWIHMMYMMISRTAYERIGGLDERFFMYGEDADYGRRLTQAGFRVSFTPGATVKHGTSFSGTKRWGVMAVVKRQFALFALLNKWYSPAHVAAFRAASAVQYAGQLCWGLIDRGFWDRTSRDRGATLALFRCCAGLMRPEELNGPRFDAYAQNAAN